MTSVNFEPCNLNLGCESRHDPQAIMVDLPATDMPRPTLRCDQQVESSNRQVILKFM